MRDSSTAGPAPGAPTSPGARAAALAGACHPGPTVVVTTLCAVLAAGVGAGAGGVLLVAAVVLAGQLSIGWSNDWLDAARDVAVGRADKPVVRGAVSPAVLRTAAWVALGASVVLSVPAGAVAVLAHAGVVAGGWAYNLGLKATAWSWLPYAVAFALLPVFVVAAAPGPGRPAAWLPVVGALLGVGAHLANVLPDLEDDAATGVRGLPHRLGRRWTGVLAPVVLAAAVLVAVVGPDGSPGAAPVGVGVVAVVVAVAGVVAGSVRPRSRVPFACAMGTAGLCVAALVAGGAAGAVV